MKSCIFLQPALALAAVLFANLAPADELVSIKAVDPTIEVELRYATVRNVTGKALYPPNLPAMVRPSVAAQLTVAQNYLQARGFRLKIWDAYRPKTAHEQLWQFLPDTSFVANPADGYGSLHTWGVAVDATLVYANGQAVAMPTDFDEFTPAAMLRYAGSSGSVREHLHTLQRAMAHAGFYGMRTEWWHFVAKDWQKYKSVDVAENQPSATSQPNNARNNSRLPIADNRANHPQPVRQ